MVLKSKGVKSAIAGTVMAPPPTPKSPASSPEPTPIMAHRMLERYNGEKGCTAAADDDNDTGELD